MAYEDVTQIEYSDPNITAVSPVRAVYIAEPRTNLQLILTTLDKHRGAQGDKAHPTVTTTNNGFAPSSIYALLDSLEAQLDELADAVSQDVYPPYSIVVWNGDAAEIPENWVLCDGTNGTPDMRYRFPIGTSTTYPLKSSGGSTSITVNIADIFAKHRHSYKNALFPFSSYDSSKMSRYTEYGTIYAPSSGGVDQDNYPIGFNETTGSAGSASSSGTATTTYLPPYAVKWYIMRKYVPRVEPKYYTVTVTQPSNGIIFTNVEGKVKHGKPVAISVKANPGYVVDTVYVNGESLINNCLIYIYKDTTITAVCSAKS